LRVADGNFEVNLMRIKKIKFSSVLNLIQDKLIFTSIFNGALKQDTVLVCDFKQQTNKYLCIPQFLN
jgi:hypothetical protein